MTDVGFVRLRIKPGILCLPIQPVFKATISACSCMLSQTCTGESKTKLFIAKQADSLTVCILYFIYMYVCGANGLAIPGSRSLSAQKAIAKSEVPVYYEREIQ